MAQKVVTLLTDDISGEEFAEGEGDTVEFSFQGYTYSIDLNTENVQKFQDTIAFYIERSRRTGKTNVVSLRRNTPAAARRGNSEFDPAEVRAWAEEHGFEVSPRGRLKGEILDAYRATLG